MNKFIMASLVYLYFLISMPVIVGVGDESGYRRNGCMCDPGFYVSTPCNKSQNASCSECPNDTFSSKLDISTSCQDCRQCGISSVKKPPCNSVTDTVCGCPDGKVPRYYEEGKDFDCANSPKQQPVTTPPPVATPPPVTSTDKHNPKSGSNSHFLGYKNGLMVITGCIVGVYIKYILTFTSQ